MHRSKVGSCNTLRFVRDANRRYTSRLWGTPKVGESGSHRDPAMGAACPVPTGTVGSASNLNYTAPTTAEIMSVEKEHALSPVKLIATAINAETAVCFFDGGFNISIVRE